MLLKVITNILLIATLVPIYFIAASRDLFIRSMIPLYYPGGILLLIITITLINKTILKNSTPFILSSIGCGIVVLYLFSQIMSTNPLLRDIFTDYFSDSNHVTMLEVPEYIRSNNNYITVTKELKRAGVKVKSIKNGYSESYNLDLPKQVSQQVVYLINNELYIIFDWESRTIVNMTSVTELLSHFKETEKNDISKAGTMRGTISSYNILLESNQLYMRFYIYPKNNDFAFELKKRKY